jgi:hypothetical protein
VDDHATDDRLLYKFQKRRENKLISGDMNKPCVIPVPHDFW